MINVEFIVEQFALPSTPWDDVPDEPISTVIEQGVLTFRELTEALEEYDYRDGIVSRESGFDTVRSMRLTNPARARYWHKAINRRFSHD